MAADKVNSLSVFLINKVDYTKYKDLVVDSLSTKPIKIDDGELFYKISEKDNYPSWVDRFFGAKKLGENRKKLSTKTLAAVFFTSITVEGKRHTFAIAFGNGRYLIKKGVIQHDFGLDTSKHAIDTARINSIRTTTYDSSIKDKIIRSAVDIRQSDFFLNANTDAMTAVSGKVRTEGMGELLKNRTIGGKDSVSMTAKVDVSNIKQFLTQLYEQYISEGKEGIRYESNIRKLTTEKEITLAEGLLQKAVDNYKKEGNLYLNLPIDELGRRDRVTGYTIEGTEYSELTTVLLDKYSTIEKLKQASVTINGEEESEAWTIEYPLYDFLYAEIEQDKHYYILASGAFYSITKGYKKRVDDYYKEVEIETLAGLKAWDGGCEGDFNNNQKSDTILVMDEKFVYPEGQDRFEVCDLLCLDKHIVYAKIFDVASQPLGHLFNQGMLSAQCMSDDDIRPLIQKKINDLQEDEHKANDFSLAEPFNPNDYTVTFLLLCSENTKYYPDGRPKIPFLARAVFRENGMAISGLRFNVKLAYMGATKKSRTVKKEKK